MKGHRLNAVIEQRVNGWLKGNNRQQQSQSLKMTLMSCLREIESRHSVSESEILRTRCSPFVQRETFIAQLGL